MAMQLKHELNVTVKESYILHGIEAAVLLYCPIYNRFKRTQMQIQNTSQTTIVSGLLQKPYQKNTAYGNIILLKCYAISKKTPKNNHLIN